MIFQNPNQLVCGIFLISLIFIMVGHVFREQVQNALKQKLFHVKAFDIDWWSVTHLLLYMLIGFIKPGFTLTFFVIGILFEVFEDMCASDSATQLLDCVNPAKKNSICGKIMCNGFDDSYWYGKFDDIFANLLGYVIGNSIRTTYF